MAIKQVMSRIAQSGIVMLILSFIVFALLHLVPGDIVKTLVGTRRVTDEVRAAITAQYNLDDPFIIQYGKWLMKALTGDFGVSIRSQVPVTDIIVDRLPVTIGLTVISFLMALAIGIPLGIVAARRADSRLDRGIVSVAVVGISAPGFALGMLLIYIFSVMLGWFPVHGIGRTPLDFLWHLILPSLALAVGIAALIIRITRAAVARELEQDYVTFARSRGLSATKISAMFMKNASIPIITSAGLVLGALFGSTVLVEQTFSLPGIGQLLADSITFKDVPIVQAVVLLVALVIVIVTLVVDLLVIMVDPTVHKRRGLQWRG